MRRDPPLPLTLAQPSPPSQSRWIYATVMLAALLTTIVLAIAAPAGTGGLIILLVIVQWVAMMCYCITYIPFGEQMVKGFWSRIFGGGGGGGGG